MIALLVSPGYVSHYFPLSAVGGELRARGVEVVVATGPFGLLVGARQGISTLLTRLTVVRSAT